MNGEPPRPARINPETYRLMRDIEDSHWWFDGMERITAGFLDRAGVAEIPMPDKGPCILDAGCGTGRSLRFLSKRGRATGVDYSPIALGCCGERGLGRLVCASVNRLPLEGGSFDLVTSFDVLSHAAVDETAALAEFARVLRPGGHLLVRVAAYNWLRGRHDRQWAIARRYRLGELRGKFAQAGLGMVHASYANLWLLPAVILKRMAERQRPGSDTESDLRLGAGAGRLSAFLRTLLSSEAILAARCGLPAGLSLFALGRKENDE